MSFAYLNRGELLVPHVAEECTPDMSQQAGAVLIGLATQAPDTITFRASGRPGSGGTRTGHG
jgi:hypothetical protein